MSSDECRGTWHLLARNDKYRFTETNILSVENESFAPSRLKLAFLSLIREIISEIIFSDVNTMLIPIHY